MISNQTFFKINTYPRITYQIIQIKQTISINNAYRVCLDSDIVCVSSNQIKTHISEIIHYDNHKMVIWTKPYILLAS